MATSFRSIDTDAVRVRFAPSPTGTLHIGGARTAYFNWLFARKHGGTFVLRIDDTDTKRSTEASYQQILSSFRWLGMDWDEGPDVGGPCGPYRQSQRYTVYREALDRLIAEDKVYPCFCTADELKAEREATQARGGTPLYSGKCRHLSQQEREDKLQAGVSHTWRLRVPTSGSTVVQDLIRGDVAFENDGLDDFIVWKAEDAPTYHFASCVDDASMEITHIIRADEHLTNTPRHVLLFHALSAKLPTFAHVPMILAPDRSKLSKRHGATSVEEYRDAGILPEALVNYLLLLGFSPGDDKEVLARQEAVDLFELTRVATHAAIYDVKKLEWLNAQYLRNMPASEVLRQDQVWTGFKANGWAPERMNREQVAWILRVISAVQERARLLPDIVDHSAVYFEDITDYDSKGVRKHFSKVQTADYLEKAADALQAVDPFTAAEIEPVYRRLIGEWGIKGGELIHPTRLALTGMTVGPGLFDVMEMLGRDVCHTRMRGAARKITSGMFAGSND